MLTVVKGPYLQWPTENSITIMWETSVPASSKWKSFFSLPFICFGRVSGGRFARTMPPYGTVWSRSGN